MSDFTDHLFSYVAPERIQTLSCGHVIPVENLIAWPIPRGPSGQEFEFTFAKRNSLDMVRERYPLRPNSGATPFLLTKDQRSMSLAGRS